MKTQSDLRETYIGWEMHDGEENSFCMACSKFTSHHTRIQFTLCFNKIIANYKKCLEDGWKITPTNDVIWQLWVGLE